MNSLFSSLPMPGQSGGATPPAEAALPSLPAPDAGWDEEWAHSLTQMEAPEEDWGEVGEEEASASPITVASPGGGSDHGPAAGAGWGMPHPEELTAGLNPAQKEAVLHAGSPLLIIAGAGSGKTRVLTHRIAYLLGTGRARPGEILAITFTNKAAAEMRERVAGLVGSAGERMWVSTFHSACVRILRREHEAAGLRSTFSIYDSADSQRLITLVVKELGIDSKRFTPKTFAARISDLKNELITPAQYADRAITSNPLERHLVEVYRAYDQRLRAANALDFDDLIMRTVQLLQSKPAVAEMYRRRFRHILVDEYQDTNHAQYVLVRELTGGPGTSGAGSGLPPAELTVVGDSDQSIYAFRGATIRNIEEFEQDYPAAHTIVLEQNYRSTQNILDAANAVIARNQGRRKKNLFTDSGAGAPVVGYVADSEHDEARWISGEIDRLADDAGVRPRDVAIFYRTNAQSRALEEALMRAGQPYKVVGGTRFYERREIKDAIAYLRAIDNPDDDVSMRRILNVPKRGLGDKAEAALSEHAAHYGVSFGVAVADAAGALRPAPQDMASGGAAVSSPAEPAQQEVSESTEASSGVGNSAEAAGLEGTAAGAGKRAGVTPPEVEGLTTRARTQITAFHRLLADARHQLAAGDGVADILDSILDASGYLAELRASDDPQDATRVENLAELHAVATDFQAANPGAGLVDFLERVSLVADADQLPDAEDEEGAARMRDDGQITLMTVHTAKGLEFPVVFVTGMEDGTFPHSRSLGDESELAEERRLAYVALTRARQRLYVTRAAVRSAWGSSQAMPASRFLDDIPSEVIEWKRLASSMDALRGGGTGWGSSWGEGGFAFSGARSRRTYEDDDFAPVIGSGKARTGKLGRVETAKDRAAARRAARAGAGSGAAPVRLDGSSTGADESSLPEAVQGLRVGDQVTHERFGVGEVSVLEGKGSSRVAHVVFTIDGARTTKRLMLRLAPLKKI